MQICSTLIQQENKDVKAKRAKKKDVPVRVWP
jgi:hypothetical protein